MQPKIHHILLLAMVLFLPVVLIVFPSAIAWGANLSIPATVGALDCATFGGGVQSGDTLTLAPGTRGPLTIRNCTGSASNPIKIQNSATGPTIIQRSTGGAGSFVFVCDDCVNVVIDGTIKWPGAPAGKSYGIKVTMTGGGSPAAFVKIGGKSRFLTIRGVEVDGAWPRLADNGIGISVNDHAVDAVDNPGLWREGIVIEKSYIHHVEGEGLYVGPNVPQGDIPLRNISIRDNLVEETGWDGINLKSTIQGTNEIHHNIVRNVGRYVEPNPEAGQRGGISLYEGNGRIYNNWVQNAGESAITLYNQFLPASYGTQSVEIFNNVVINAGVTGPLDGKGISVGSTDNSSIANTSGKIYNNTVVDSEASGIVMGSRTSGGFIRDNIVVDSGASDISAPSGASVTNNRTGTKASIGFVNPAAFNFRLSASSPARNAGSNVYPSVDIADIARPQDGGPDQGAYEGGGSSLFPSDAGSSLPPPFTPPSTPPVCVEPPVITPGPVTDRNIHYYSGFESGRVLGASNLVDGLNLKTLSNPQIGDAFVSTGGAAGAGPETNWDTKVVRSELVGGQTVLPRSGSYFLRSAIYFTKDYLNYNNGDSDKPRALMHNYPANSVDFDEEAWVGFSIFLPKNWEHELGVRDHRGGNMLFVVNADTDSTFLALHPYVPPGETVTHWKLLVQTDATSAYESSSAGEVTDKHEWVDLGSVVPDLGIWTDFVIRFRSNPFAVATNPAALGIRDSMDKTYQGNRGILQVWKAEGPADANGNRNMVQKINKVNVPLGLVPRADPKLRMDIRQYKYGWKKNPTTVTGPVWVGFDEFRFGITSRDQTGFADVAPGGASAGTVIPPGSDPLCTTPPVTPPICAFTPIKPPFSITNDKTDSHRFNLPPNTIKKIVVANLPQSATCRTSSGSTNSWRPSGGPWCTVDGLLGDTWSYTNGTTCSYSRDTITDKTLRVGISTTPGDISAGGNMVLGFGGNVLGYCGTADQMAVSRAEFIVKTFGTPGPGECVIKPNVDYYMNVGTLINLLPRNPKQTTDYYGIVMSDNAPELPLSGSAPTVTSPVPSPTPIPAPLPNPLPISGTKWFPGHYFRAHYDQPLTNAETFLRHPESTGLQYGIDWSELEGSKGQYNFSKIDEIIALANRYGKKINLKIEDRDFGGNVNGNMPAYLQASCVWDLNGKGGALKWWDATCVNHFLDLYRALSRYDCNTTLASITIGNGESALGGSTQPGYSHEAYITEYTRALTEIKALFPNTLVLIGFNFMPQDGLRRVAATLERIGGSGFIHPDTTPGSFMGSSADNATVIEIEYQARGVPTFAGFQDPQVPSTVPNSALLEWAVNTIHAPMWAWNHYRTGLPSYRTDLLAYMSTPQAQALADQNVACPSRLAPCLTTLPSCSLPPTPIPAPSPVPGPLPTLPTSSGGTLPLVGKSRLPWNSGQWINGDSNRMSQYTAFIGHEPDAVTQSMSVIPDTWANLAGATSDAVVDQEFVRTPAQWVSTAPSFEGVFKGSAWMSHIWGGYPATEHRKRIIHLGWMDVIPRESSNAWTGSDYRNPRVWKDIKDGMYDKYFFLLGRKFAYLDAKYGDTAYPMTFDFPYEWTLETHTSSPEGSYLIGTTKYFTYQDFPYGWARMHRVFAEGYKYQRGTPMPYNFAWRPQLRFITSDARGGGSTIHHESMWPNDIATWQVPANVINGVTVLPAGPIGKTVHLVGASWHDSSFVEVRGASATAPNNTWGNILAGNNLYWGLNEIISFAKEKGVGVMFPEWGAHRPEETNPSDYPADFYRFTHAYFLTNKDALRYETVFDQGDGSLYKPWIYNGQDAVATYKALWGY